MTLFSQNIQLGIDSLTNGSREDALGNYLEAKHLYKKGIEYFMNEINSGVLGEMTSTVVNAKAEVYAKRIKEIEIFLEAHPNYTRRKILTRQSNFEIDFNNGNVPKYYIEQAIVQASNAIEADRKGNYFLALESYEKAVALFMKAIDHEVEGELARDALRMQCTYYLNKCDQIMSLIKSTK